MADGTNTLPVIPALSGKDANPPRRETSRDRAKAATAAKVLAAARCEFEARGYEAATIRAIAAKAGMSTGAIFAHHADKAALYRAVYGHAPISPEVGRAMLQALEAAETLYLNGILNTPSEAVSRVHALRRAAMAVARAQA